MNFNNDNKDTAAILEANERIRDEMRVAESVLSERLRDVLSQEMRLGELRGELERTQSTERALCMARPLSTQTRGVLTEKLQALKERLRHMLLDEDSLFSLHNQRQEHYKERCKLLDRSSSELQQKRIELEVELSHSERLLNDSYEAEKCENAIWKERQGVQKAWWIQQRAQDRHLRESRSKEMRALYVEQIAAQNEFVAKKVKEAQDQLSSLEAEIEHGDTLTEEHEQRIAALRAAVAATDSVRNQIATAESQQSALSCSLTNLDNDITQMHRTIEALNARAQVRAAELEGLSEIEAKLASSLRSVDVLKVRIAEFHRAAAKRRSNAACVPEETPATVEGRRDVLGELRRRVEQERSALQDNMGIIAQRVNIVSSQLHQATENTVVLDNRLAACQSERLAMKQKAEALQQLPRALVEQLQLRR